MSVLGLPQPCPTFFAAAYASGREVFCVMNGPNTPKMSCSHRWLKPMPSRMPSTSPAMVAAGSRCRYLSHEVLSRNTLPTRQLRQNRNMMSPWDIAVGSEEYGQRDEARKPAPGIREAMDMTITRMSVNQRSIPSRREGLFSMRNSLYVTIFL